MPNRYDRDDFDERNRGEYSGGLFGNRGELGGYYARDTHRGYGDDYARDGGWSGAGRADEYTREPQRPSYRGRGPKNWRPSDERIRDTVNELLTDHDGIDATDVEVTVENGEVTLEGKVGSRWQKRLADDIAHSCRGVQDVHNRLRIADRETQIGKASE
jgi:osmotically-inducible protein OsmY